MTLNNKYRLYNVADHYILLYDNLWYEFILDGSLNKDSWTVDTYVFATIAQSVYCIDILYPVYSSDASKGGNLSFEKM